MMRNQNKQKKILPIPEEAPLIGCIKSTPKMTRERRGPDQRRIWAVRILANEKQASCFFLI